MRLMIPACLYRTARCAPALLGASMLVAMAGCSKPSAEDAPSPEVQANGTHEPDEATHHFSSDPTEALEQVAEAAFAAFDANKIIVKQIYPTGYSKHWTKPLQKSTEVTRSEGDSPRQAILRLTYQKLFTLIYDERDDAEADDDLLPFWPGTSRKSMTESLTSTPSKPVVLSIDYEWRDGAWRRGDWTTEPKQQEGDDFLDRVQVP